MPIALKCSASVAPIQACEGAGRRVTLEAAIAELKAPLGKLGGNTEQASGLEAAGAGTEAVKTAGAAGISSTDNSLRA